MNSTVMTIARGMALRQVKKNIQAQALRVSDYDVNELRLLAAEWLQEHPELIAEAAQVVERDPVQRAIAEREASAAW
jgi:hypothetical protein